MIIWGFKTMVAMLGMATTPCQSCHNPAAQRIERYRRWFTLFFIPLIPYSTSYVMTCSFCGSQFKIEKDQAEAILGHGQPQGGPGMPPQGGPQFGADPYAQQGQYGQQGGYPQQGQYAQQGYPQQAQYGAPGGQPQYRQQQYGQQQRGGPHQ